MTRGLLEEGFAGRSIDSLGWHDHPVLCTKLKGLLSVVELGYVSPAEKLTLK